MRCLITGMAGFVGRHLAETLRQGSHECAGFDHPGAKRPDAECSGLDILDAGTLDDFISQVRPEKVFHLAAQSGVGRSWKDPETTFRINVIGTINLLESVKRHSPSARVLLVSSGEVYGSPRPDAGPLTEDDEPAPRNPYALSKLAAEQYADLYRRVHGLDLIRVRPLGHTGPGQPRGFAAPDFASQVAAIEKGKQEPVMRTGNLDARREFMDVRDVVRAYSLVMEKGESGEVYNLASGKLYSVREMLDLMLEIAGIDVRIEKDPGLFRPVDMEPLKLDASRLARVTGWKPEFDLRRTISDLLDYYRDWVSSTVEPSSTSDG